MESIYEELKKIENYVDQAALKKRLMIEESHGQRIKCVKRLRVFINVNIQNNIFYLRVHGKVINDFKNFVEMQTSDLLKRFYVQTNFNKTTNITGDEIPVTEVPPCDETMPAANNINGTLIDNFYEWNKSEGYPTKVDSFELICPEIPHNLRLFFEFENSRDIYKLTPGLSKLLNKTTDTKTRVIVDLWKYIKIHRLLDGSGIVKCDETLKEIFGLESFDMEELSMILNAYLVPLDILEIEVPVTDKYSRIFDVRLELDDLVDFPLLYQNKNIGILENKINELQAIIKQIKERKETLRKFSENPDKFMRDWVNKQSKDLKLIEERFCGDEGFFCEPLVQETVFQMLQNTK
ncbi:SWI/SNF complex component SNF12 like protein [Astathelohania contejeani]|uniref:SWI/SNF complex component SNF12 like protein n=1 Tax=Astathelohania contejeani TaxID=164912 RepID=A0ABQ7I2C0_9MICR|nr:SWI/SNF complex component SNF12 like protein [Thelohania contejeani]